MSDSETDAIWHCSLSAKAVQFIYFMHGLATLLSWSAIFNFSIEPPKKCIISL